MGDMEQATGVYHLGAIQLCGQPNWPEGTPVRVLPCGVADSAEHLRHGHVIIGGMGLAGHFVLEWCRKQGIPVQCVDGNPATIEQLKRGGTPALTGDIRRREILQAARLDEAQAVAVMVPDEKQMLEAVRTIRELNGQVLIFARAHFNKTAQEAHLLGANEVVDQEGLVAYEIVGRLAGRLCPHAR